MLVFLSYVICYITLCEYLVPEKKWANFQWHLIISASQDERLSCFSFSGEGEQLRLNRSHKRSKRNSTWAVRWCYEELISELDLTNLSEDVMSHTRNSGIANGQSSYETRCEGPRHDHCFRSSDDWEWKVWRAVAIRLPTKTTTTPPYFTTFPKSIYFFKTSIDCVKSLRNELVLLVFHWESLALHSKSRKPDRTQRKH